MSSSREVRTAEVAAIHREIDEAVAALLRPLGVSLECRLGCTDCCIDGVSVFEVEAEHIARGLSEGIDVESSRPGRCAFLDDQGACTIYARRPYVCRTQGLPLRWLEDAEDELIERRDICELNEMHLDLLELPPEHCWTLGPFEGRLATLQARCDGGQLRRIALREVASRLFNPLPGDGRDR